jgi:anti-sigma factor RsiW
MDRPDHSVFREWLEMEADGTLQPERRAPLERHLAACPECRAEREDLAELNALLRRQSLAVQPDFRDDVMAALPDAGWEGRHPRTWQFPAAVILLLGGIAAFLLGSNASELGAGSSGLEALGAVAGMFGAAIQAGAGLLFAAGSGASLIAGEVFSSPVSLVAFGFLVVCLNLLLFSLLRRKRAAGSGVIAGRHRGAGGL